jgi:hypothetical protein
MLTHPLQQVNWEKVAIEMGYKNAIVASTRFNQIKKKMESTFETSTSSGSSTESTPSKTPKAKANKVTKAGAKPRTPRKGVAHPVQKGAKSAGKVTKEEDSGDDEKEVGFHEKMEEFDDEKFKYEMEEGNDEQVSV